MKLGISLTTGSAWANADTYVMMAGTPDARRTRVENQYCCTNKAAGAGPAAEDRRGALAEV